MINIGVLVSGGGTNLQALIDAIENDQIKNGRIAIVVSSKKDVYALERAKKHNILSCVISRKEYNSINDFDKAIIQKMKEYNVELIVMAGFLSIVGKDLVDEYTNRIINIHPALIPSFCGEGYYGLKVHEAALKRGVKITGATVHFVNEIADGGPIIIQDTVSIQENDTPEILQRRVMEEVEWKVLPKSVKLFCEGKLSVKDGKVLISE